MVDVASPFRLLISAHGADYCANLQYCCDHYRSVSEVCRRLKVNRQQLNRYLAGSAAPSRHNHRRVSDFFGLEEHQLLMPHEAFAATFAQRAAARQPLPALDRHAALLRDASRSGSRDLHEYRGFYFKYFYSYLGSGRIKRELAHWRYDGDTLVSSVKHRFTGEDEDGEVSPRFATYRGLVGAFGDRLTTIDVQRGGGHEMSMMILYPKRRLLRRLHGMMIGVPRLHPRHRRRAGRHGLHRDRDRRPGGTRRAGNLRRRRSIRAGAGQTRGRKRHPARRDPVPRETMTALFPSLCRSSSD
jgi:hypothetical protein